MTKYQAFIDDLKRLCSLHKVKLHASPWLQVAVMDDDYQTTDRDLDGDSTDVFYDMTQLP